jgi:hypothetical protein
MRKTRRRETQQGRRRGRGKHKANKYKVNIAR